VVPFTTWPDEGAPDYRNRDLLPVRLPPRRAGEPPLWEIPITLGYTRQPQQFWRRYYERIESTWLGKLRLIGIGDRLGLVRKVWLNFEQPHGAWMLDWLPSLAKQGLPCICFTVHSSSLVAGDGPYTRNSEDEKRIYALIERVFACLAGSAEFTPITMTRLAQRLEADYDARCRD
jgi:hypothetical protein